MEINHEHVFAISPTNPEYVRCTLVGCQAQRKIVGAPIPSPSLADQFSASTGSLAQIREAQKAAERPAEPDLPDDQVTPAPKPLEDPEENDRHGYSSSSLARSSAVDQAEENPYETGEASRSQDGDPTTPEQREAAMQRIRSRALNRDNLDEAFGEPLRSSIPIRVTQRAILVTDIQPGDYVLTVGMDPAHGHDEAMATVLRVERG